MIDDMTPEQLEALANEIRSKADDGRNVLEVGNELTEDVDTIAQSLEGVPGIYSIGGKLVRLVAAGAGEQDGAIRRDSGAPVIKQMMPISLEYVIGQRYAVRKTDKRSKNRLVPTEMPGKRMAGVLDLGAWPVPELRGGVAMPIVRKDGSVFAEPNRYDPETGYLFSDPSGSTWKVSENLTKGDAVAAWGEILDVVADFPFKNGLSLAAFAAMVLTPGARPAMSAPAPLFSCDANTRGSGKTRLAQIVGYIATGAEPTLCAGVSDSDEMRKRLMSIVMAGDPVVVLDNLVGDLRSPELDAVLTTGTFSDRLLGETQMIKCPVSTTFIATANNLTLGGDLDRRTIQIRLESGREDPENRDDFRYPDLWAEVRDRRVRLATAVATIIAAWRQNAEGVDVPRLGSFEDWSEVVRGAVMWLGLGDPVETQREIESDNRSERRQMGVLLDEIYSAYGESQWTAAMIVKNAADDLSAIELEAVDDVTRKDAAKDPAGSSRSLAKMLKYRKGRKFDGYTLGVEEFDNPKLVGGSRVRAAFWVKRAT